ncbi:hypothetical protein [Azospirillum agricola]|nr:hypothetical protein [Azospirillum agricola]
MSSQSHPLRARIARAERRRRQRFLAKKGTLSTPAQLNGLRISRR